MFVVIASALRGADGGRPVVVSVSTTDADLVSRCVDGDRAAFDTLYRRHAEPVYGRMRRLVGPIDDLDDLVQQAFLEAFRSLSRFRGDASFGTWLYRITVNVAYAWLRKQRRNLSVAWSPEQLDAVSAPASDPLERAHARAELERALRHVAALKPNQRIAFVLRHVEGLSVERIATLVGAKAPAVSARVKKAERELATRLEREQRRRSRVEVERAS